MIIWDGVGLVACVLVVGFYLAIWVLFGRGLR